MQNTGKKYISIFSIAVIILAALATIAALQLIENRYTITVPTAQKNPPPPAIRPPNTPLPPPSELYIPPAKLLSVPFTPQAPTANWDELHGEACEEASSIMAYAFFAGMAETTLSPEFVEIEISKLVEWQTENLGYYLDINAEETARMIEENYNLTATVVPSFTEERIKQEITKGNLVLVPAQGQLLGNPNFRRPGPPYHMLVIRGFTSQDFITNDPGTKRGENYAYPFNVLYAANGDFNHETHAVDTDKKTIIIVSK